MNEYKKEKIIFFCGPGLGDTLATFPAIKFYLEKLPKNNYWVVTQENFKDIFKVVFPDIKFLSSARNFKEFLYLTQEIKNISFNKAINFNHSLVPGLITKLSKVNSFGYKANKKTLFLKNYFPAPAYWNEPVFKYKNQNIKNQYENFFLLVKRINNFNDKVMPQVKASINEKEIVEIKRYLKNFQFNKFVIIHSISSKSYLWKAKYWARVADYLQQKLNYGVIFTGLLADIKIINEILSYMKTKPILFINKSLKEIMFLIYVVKKVISLDTGIAHLSALSNAQTLILFGPGDYKIWSPPFANVLAIYNEDGCYGCKKPSCINVQHFCMDSIKPEVVIKNVENFLLKND